jgi:peptide/nickel transport system substrate-binding protein
MLKKLLGSISTFLVLVLCLGTANAAELTVATPYEPSIDPHFLYLSSNTAYSRHLFGNLADRRGKDARIDPGMSTAESWKILDPTTWEFKLRKGVKFHDGSELTAEDVVFSIHRIPRVPNNPASYETNVRMISDITIKDPYTLIIKTKEPYPLLPNRLSSVSLVSKRLVQDATTADFTSGKVAIGTGPYKFVEYVPADHYVIERNDDYWGEKPAFKRVVFKIMPNTAARVAALLGGDVDLVENFPPNQVPTLEGKKGVHAIKRASSRTLFLEIDSNRDQSPYVTDKEGKPLPKNPLKDVRVRDAISKAINRDAIVKKVMLGLAEEANQLLPRGWYSYNDEIEDEPYDPESAKQLLASAGYPDGFGLTIHAPNDRYVNDEKIAQAVAQMLARIGIKMKVETMPKNVYFGRLNKREFSLAMIGWDNSVTGSSLMCLSAAFHTYDKAAGYGTWNGGGYSNPEFDKAIEQAAATFDKKKAEDLLRKAMKILINDQGAIPLHSQFTIFGARDGIEYTPRVDEHFYAVKARPKK